MTEWNSGKNFVPDEGSLNARIVLIGEAPGTTENSQRRPFVGTSGRQLYDWWDECSLRRLDFYITNVVPYQPPGNRLAAVPAGQMHTYEQELRDRISALTNPYVIVPTGNTALHALTSKREITKYRGSILSFTDNKGRTIKVIPTRHPAGLLYSKKATDSELCVLDWKRISADAAFPELRLPEREHVIFPSEADMAQFYKEAASDPTVPMSVDIETPGRRLSCVGFSLSLRASITIVCDEAGLAMIRRLLLLPNYKIFQNGLFDNFYLRRAGIRVVNWYWDTLAMHHCFDADMPHDLATMASIFTREPYWKDEAKDPDKIAKYTDNEAAFYTYNGKDAAVTHELFGVFHQVLLERGLLLFYHRHYYRMFQPLLSMMLRGIKVDRPARKREYADLGEKRREIKEQLKQFAGKDLWGPKGAMSATRLQTLLYTDLKLPKQFKRGRRKKDGTMPVTSDETALKKLEQKFGTRTVERNGIKWTIAQLVATLLNERRYAKLQTFLDDKMVDRDDRIRCSYRFTTKFGRLNSSKNPWGTGGNLQNQDREIRSTFIPG